MTEWSYRHETVDTGPVTLEELRNAIVGGRLSVTDFVRRGEGTWMPAAACPELAGMFGVLLPPPPPPPPTMLVSNVGVDATAIWPWLVGAGVGTFVVLTILLAIAGLAGSQPSKPVPTSTMASGVVPGQASTAVEETVGPLIDISGVDATPELGRIIAQMNEQQKLAIGFYNASTGLDFYAARVRVLNSGDQAYFVAPKNIRLHLYGESVGILPMKDSRFLQPTMLMPDHYIEGLVVYLAAPHAGAAMRLGQGSISYEFAD